MGKVPGKYVSTEDTANDVSQMRHIIHIGQGAGDQNVLFSFYGKTVKWKEMKQKRVISVKRQRRLKTNWKKKNAEKNGTTIALLIKVQ